MGIQVGEEEEEQGDPDKMGKKMSQKAAPPGNRAVAQTSTDQRRAEARGVGGPGSTGAVAPKIIINDTIRVLPFN